MSGRDTLPRCTLCSAASDPRHGVYAADGNPYPLCDGCAPDSNQRDVDRVAAACVATGQAGEAGYPRFWPKATGFEVTS